MTLLERVGEIDDRGETVQLVSRMRAEGHDPRVVAAVLTQARLRRRAREKFGPFAAGMLFTEDGLQQATRLRVAAHHADRFRGADARAIADLGCGIGADALAFASLGFEVLAVDADEVTAAIAAHNLAAFENARVRHARAEHVDLAEVDAVWFDPARRDTSSRGAAGSWRLHDPADWSPPLDLAFGAARTHAVGVKLAPGIDHDVLPADAETQWVSVDGDLVEATVWAGGTERAGVRRSALVIGEGADELAAPGPASDEPVGELGDVLYEPDPAVIRARLIGDVARSLGARMLAPGIAWMTGDDVVPTPFASAFAVSEVLPLQVSKLARELRARGIGRLEIKKRGVDLDPAALRSQLRLRGDESATLICTRIGDARRAILADRVR